MTAALVVAVIVESSADGAQTIAHGFESWPCWMPEIYQRAFGAGHGGEPVAHRSVSKMDFEASPPGPWPQDKSQRNGEPKAHHDVPPPEAQVWAASNAPI